MLVRKLRIQKGWSQETLAEISDLSVRTVQRIERGGNASLETLGALASALDVEISTLATETKMYKQQELDPEESDALQHVRDIKGFYSHVVFYLVSMAALIATNLYMGVDNLWVIWPLLGWGTGVVMHGLAVFEVFTFFDVEWERRQIERWLGRNRR